MRKKIICFLLTAALMITSIDFTAWAAGNQGVVRTMVTEQAEYEYIAGMDSTQEGENLDSEEKDSEQESENPDSEKKDSEQESENPDSEEKDSEQESENPDSEEKDSEQEGESPDSEENTSTEDLESEVEEKDSVTEGPNKEIEGITEESGMPSLCGLANYEVAEKFARGSGTEQDPYEIRTIEELNLFSQEASKSSKYYKLVQNIRLNDSLDSPTNVWTPIENFRGHLDGNYCKIENLYICLEEVDVNVYRQDIGLFSYATSSASICDLTVENALIELNVQSVSGSPSLDMGVIIGESYASIKNCTVSGSVEMKNLNPIQGMSIASIGVVAGRNGGTLLDCSMKAAVECTGQINTNYVNTGIGGIAGVNRGTVDNCSNFGQITMEQGGAAGIAYYMYDDSGVIQSCRNEEGASVTSLTGNAAGITVQGKGSIMYCRNSGNVTATEKQIAAGIASSFSQGFIVECMNEGRLSGSGKLAGIVGYISQSGTNTISVKKCENKADISQELTTWNGYCGGIVGDIVGSRNGTGTVTVEECSNTGNITGSDIGGIIESIKSQGAQIQVSKCYNEGALNGESAAGIVWEINQFSSYVGSVTLTDCYNRGDITVSKSYGYTGGISGRISHGVIQQCYNVGKITSGGYAAGIVCESGSYGDVNDTVIEGCFNLGEIVSARTVAGIAADMKGGTISKCYNMGRIVSSVTTSSGHSIGGIVGSGFFTSETGGTGVGIIENCFNCGVIAVENEELNNVGGIAGWVCPYGEGTSMTLRHCYNIGKFEIGEQKKGYYGAIIGDVGNEQEIQTQKLYYLEDGVPAVGYASYLYELPDTKACTLDQMSQVSTYENWDFTEIWKKGSRKYAFPILRGVGESYLTYGYGGVGQDTVFGEYILQAVNSETEIGVYRAVFSYQDQTVTASENGTIRILASNTDLGMVSVVADHYHEWSGEVTLRSGEVNTVQVKPKKDINISKVSASGSTHMETGTTTIESDTSNAVDVDLPIKIDLKFKASEDKETGNNGASISDAMPVKVSWEGDTKVKISIGSETKSQAEYKYAKNLLGKWGSLPSEDVLKEMGKSDIHHISGKLGSNSVKIYLMGYMEIDFSSGSPKVVESGAVLGAEGEGSIKYRPAWAGTVAYGELKLKVGGEGKLQITFDESLGYFDFSGELKAEIKLTAAVGIGYEFAKGEVGAEGSLTGKVGIKKNWNIKDDMELKLKAVPYALLKIGFFNIKTDFDGWEWKWPETSTSSNDTVGTGIPIEEYSIMDRDYLESGAQNTMLFATHLQSARASITSLDIDGVYPEGEPQICSMTDGTQVAVWVADDGNKESADRTTIYYAVIKDDVITSYGPVYETGRGDYSPRLLAKGDSVYLAWMNADNTYGNSADFFEYYRHISLYLSVFDGMSFGEPIKVTADGNHLPMLADLSSDGNGVMVTWVENSEDDAFFIKGSNTIYSRHYLAGILEEAKVIAEGLPYIYSMDSGYVNGRYAVVWSQDTDGDLTTGVDSELYMSQGGTITQLTDNTFEDVNVRISVDDLYWCSDGIIRRMPGLEKSISESIGIACDDAFDVLQGEMGKAIIWMEKDGFITTPMISYEKGDAFTRPIPLGEFGSVNISGYNAVYEDDGSIALFYDVKEVYEEWIETPYGQTNMRYAIGLSPSDILVDDYLYYDAAATEPGQTLTFYTDVVNYTGSQINMLHLTLQVDREVLKEEDRAVELPVGGTETIGLDYVLPQEFALGNYKLTVTAAGVEENDLSNNQASTLVGYGNLALEDCDIEEKNDGSVIICGNIVNKGYRSIVGKTLYIRIDGQDGEVIGQIDLVSLAVNESQPFTFTIEESYIDFGYAYDSDYFYLSIEGDELETDFSDNSEYLVLKPILAESVDLENDFQMAVGESHELTVSITPRNAFADCMFTSSNLSVAAVDVKGTITAYEVGETVITAVTGDGKAADSCIVTVTAADDEESLVEYSMSDTIVSLSVGEELTLQIYALGEEGTEIEPVEVEWKSINEEIVTVEDNNIESGKNEDGDYVIAEGRIKALGEGSSVIIANVENSGIVYCIVTVTDDSVKAVILEKTVYEMNRGETLQLVWESKPAGAQASDFNFTSFDETVARVDAEGKVYALEQGRTKVEMSYTAKSGIQEITAACVIEVTDPDLTVYDLRFETNGGSVLPDSIAYQSGKAGYRFVFPETPTRPGYVFVGWNDLQDGSGTSYNGNETLIAGENIIGDLTLYAIWLAAGDGLWAAPVEDQVYTGSQLKPKAAVYNGTVILVEGKDYTLSYKNNTNVAGASDGKMAPSIVVKGKGNYTGSQTIYFNILPRNIGSSEGIEADAIYLKANSKVQKSVPVIKYNGKKLTYKKNFQLEYPDLEDNPDAYKEAGKYWIKVIGVGNYTGERKVAVTITSGNLISKAAVTKIKNQAYTGEAIEPQLTVKYGKTVLVLGTDYTVDYENNREIGKATVIITGQGAYSGVKKVTFTITGGSIKKAKVTGIPKSLVYTGEDLTIDSQSWGTVPVLTFAVNKETKTLVEGKDYTISYQKNNSVGTASIIFTGINGYSGTLKKTFKIIAYDINKDAEEIISAVLINNGEILYAKGGSKPQPTVTFGNKLLKEKMEYTLSYKNNKAINDGTNPKKVPTVTIKGKGNFKGSISLSYTIVQQDLGVLSMNVPDKAYQAKKNAYKSVPKITDIDGKTLKVGIDYEKSFIYTYKDDTELVDGTLRDAGAIVEANDIIPAGTTVEVEVTSKGNYSGSLRGEYRVVQQSVSSAKVTIPAQEYTGKAIKPGKDVLTVKLGKIELGEDDYEIVSYDNNVNKGKASITIKGVGNYGGSKTVKFTIKAKSFLWW